MARNDNDDNNIHSGGITSSTVWWGAGGVIVLVIAGLLWILLSGGGSGSTATPTRTVTASPTAGNTGTATVPSASPSSGTTVSAGGRCNPLGASSLVPTSAIPVTWQAVGGIAVPVSSSAGPTRVTGPGGTLRSCYQQSPTGAVLAAMNVVGAGTTSNEQQVIQQAYTPGPGRTEAMQQPADSGGGSIAGFTAEACTQSACLVKVGFSVQGEYVAATLPMIWTQGDWKVNGEVTGVAQPVQVTGLGGYIPMSAAGAAS